MNDSKLFNSIHNCVPWQNSFEKPLQAYKFLEPIKSQWGDLWATMLKLQNK
jgi:hypothetical protein